MRQHWAVRSWSHLGHVKRHTNTTSNVKLSNEDKESLEVSFLLGCTAGSHTRRPETSATPLRMPKNSERKHGGLQSHRKRDKTVIVFRRKLKHIINFGSTWHSAKFLLTVPSATYKQGWRFPCPRHAGIWGSRGIVPLILNFGTRWKWVVNAPAALARQRYQYPFHI